MIIGPQDAGTYRDYAERVSLKSDVLHCARCEGDHLQLRFIPFKFHAVTDADGVIYSHWALCPVSGDPILLMRFEVRLP